MGFPTLIVNRGVSPNSSDTVTLPNATAGNLIVVVLAFPGTASLNIGTLIRAVSNTASIWYCVLAAGGVANITFASAGPGAWIFEIACPDPEWTLLDAKSTTGIIAANNLYSPAPTGAVESMSVLTGNSFNCCYFTVLHGGGVVPSPGSNFEPDALYSPRWLLHPAVFGGSVVGGGIGATTVCMILNGSGVQQLQLWKYDDPAALVGLEHESIGAVFGVPS